MSSANRKPTNVSLNPRLVADARALGINVSRACESGLVIELKKAQVARWQADNEAAINAANRYVEMHGLPLEKYRLF